MKRLHTRKLALALSIAAITVLAAAVFIWGVKYKCSLYHRHPERHLQVAAAKLLSENERPGEYAAASLLRAAVSPLAVLPLLLFFTALSRDRRLAFRFSRRLFNTNFSRVWSSSFAHFSFRPPPILAF